MKGNLHVRFLGGPWAGNSPGPPGDRTDVRSAQSGNHVADRSPNRIHERQHFYKYVTAEVASIVLSNRTLRWSSPTVFNDPFDVEPELRLGFSQEELNRALQLEVARRIEEGDSNVGHPAMKALIGLIDRSGPEARRANAQALRDTPNPITNGQAASMALLRETWRDIVSKMRVLCLSERNDATSMWNHYSDGYRGVVLEFEVLDEIDSCFLCARAVTYSDSPPRLAMLGEWVDCIISGDEARWVSLFTEYQYTKTTDWAYEKEWRVVLPLQSGEPGSHSDFPFHERELTRVFLGPSIDAPERNDILSLLKLGLEHVRIYETTRSTGDNRFSFSKLGAGSRAV